jgi:pyruvate/2-oxoglutarate dehydrogenase complex dihydrolipoamide dehydrogenase (E3) component
MGRQGNTDSLSLKAVGLAADKRGLLKVNDFYQVSCTTMQRSTLYMASML